MSSKAERKRRKRTVILAKGGRPRRGEVDRYADGSIVRSQREGRDPEPMAIARAQPHRQRVAEMMFAKHLRGLDVERLFGSPLGRMFAEGVVSRRQFDAGARFAINLTRDRAILGLPAPTTQAIDYGRVVGGGKADLADDEAQKAGARLLEVRRVLAEADWPGDPVRPAFVVRQVTIEDRDESTLSEAEIGALRVGLNALARLYGIGTEEARDIAA